MARRTTRSRFDERAELSRPTGCHWLCQCSRLSSKYRHWRSQWHAGSDTLFARSLYRRQHAAVYESRADWADDQAGVVEPRAILGRAVRTTLSDDEQRRRVERHRQRAIQGIVEKR